MPPRQSRCAIYLVWGCASELVSDSKTRTTRQSNDTKPLPENDIVLTNIRLPVLRLLDNRRNVWFWRCVMRKICVLLLTIFAIGCGYSKKGSGTMASTAPTIAQLMPNSAMAGGPAFTLTVNGSNFANGAFVYWNAATRATMFVTAGQVTAAISASDIATASTVPVYVRNPGGTGIYMNQPGHNSNTVNFTVTP
jgi:hypothetical protein